MCAYCGCGGECGDSGPAGARRKSGCLEVGHFMIGASEFAGEVVDELWVSATVDAGR